VSVDYIKWIITRREIMSWQIFLTVWIFIQMVFGVARLPNLAVLKGHDINQLSGAIAGTCIKFIGMIFCLYMGGFYA
jgi:hypothetical protein